jgi:uncharacterized coiled-coil protein SlyX
MDKKQSFKEIMQELATIGKEFFASEVKTQSFVDYKAEDGSIIRTEAEIAIGAKLQVITPDGVMDVPAEVTELVIDLNGVPTKVYLENGIVSGLEPVAAEGAEDMPTGAAPQEMNADEFNAKIASLEERVAALESANQLSTQEVEKANVTIAEAASKIAAQNDLNTKLFSLIEKLADAPSVAPTSTSKEKFSKPTSTLSVLDEFRKNNFK